MPFQPLQRDQPNVVIRCLNCQTPWLVYEQQLGLSLACPACGAAGRTQYQGYQGTGGPGTQLSFGRFKRLISHPDTSADFVGLVEALLDVRHEGDLRFVDASGSVLDLEEAHYRIQSHEVSQGRMYNRAMNIIR